MTDAPPKVFVSYSHDTIEHQERVLNLADRLRDDGIDAEVDQYNAAPPEGWPLWCERQIAAATVVLIVCTETYCRRVSGDEEQGKGLGVVWEARIIRQLLYDLGAVSDKFVPVIFSDTSPEQIPTPIKGWTRYVVDTEDGYEELYRRLTGQPRLLRPALGTIRALPTRRRQWPACTMMACSVILNGLQPIATAALVGRLNFKEDLFKAFEDDTVSVSAIIADGGIGKTALLYHWLTQLDTSKYNVSHIFAWPFFDRVKRQPTTSASFFIDAFEYFGHNPAQKDLNIPDEKAKALLKTYNSHNAILAIDGLEVLQNTSDDKRGQLMDEPLSAFLSLHSTQCKHQHGRLIVITSRLPIWDLQGSPGYREIYLRPLKPANGADLLSFLGVRGDKSELEAASAEYNGHCLSLVLLGKLISSWFHDAHIRNRHQISSIVPDPFPATDPQSHAYLEQAHRIMDFYEKEISRREDIILLQMMGLFLSPMLEQQRDYVVRHADFARPLAVLSPNDWSSVAKRLEQYGLLIPQEEEGSPRTRWDCHPLVREHFRSTLRKDVDAWRNAHEVVFRYFERVADYQPNSLSGLAPLYHAVHHACLANDYKNALTLYRTRILRDEAQGFSTNRLGAAAEDVACLRKFLDTDSKTQAAVLAALGEADVAWLWSRMAFCQTCRGNLNEAVHYRIKQFEFCTQHHDIMDAASASENLSGLYVLRGNLIEADEWARRAIALAAEATDWGQEVRGRCRLGAVLYLRGVLDESWQQFGEAKRLQEQNDGTRPWLSMDHGFYYRLIALDRASTPEEYDVILHDAEGASGADQTWLAPWGLDKLVKGIALSRIGDVQSAQLLFEQAIETLKESGFVVHLPYYYNAKAEFEINLGHLDVARQSAHDAQLISYEYGLPLSEADSYIVAAETEIADRCVKRAGIALERARQLVTEYGYHYRAADLDLLDGQIALLDGRVQDGTKIVEQATRRIEGTGRKSLLNRVRGQTMK